MKYIRFLYISLAIATILGSGTIAHYFGWTPGMILMMLLGFILGIYITGVDKDYQVGGVGAGVLGFLVIFFANIITSCVFSFWLILFGAISATLFFCGMLVGIGFKHSKNLYSSIQISLVIPLLAILIQQHLIILIGLFCIVAIIQGYIIAKDYIPIKKSLLSQQEVAVILVSVGMVFVASYFLKINSDIARFMLGLFVSCVFVFIGTVAHFVAVFIQDFDGMPINR